MIGFFGGTFDPLHFGHINLALELKERAGLKEVWFCPAFKSPFKEGITSASAFDRLNMLKLGLKDVPGCKVIDDEIVREGPSYTIDTIRALMEKTGESFRLILGDDHLKEFSLWKEAEQLRKLAPLLMGQRGFSDDAAIIKTPLLDISATKIRERIKEGLYVGHLLPQTTLNYIYNHGLYLDGNQNKS